MNGFALALTLVILVLWCSLCAALFEVRDARTREREYVRRIAELETDLAERHQRERF